MTSEYIHQHLGLLIIDPYNDFLAAEGKMWPAVGTVATRLDTVANMRALAAAAHAAGVHRIFVPHRRWSPGDYTGWKFPNPSQRGVDRIRLFERGSWGGTFHADFPVLEGDGVASEHWAQNGFAGTDLNTRLTQHGITHVIAIGLLANTCTESTARFAMELGYHVTLVTDATAATSEEALHAAHAINAPTYAHAILSTQEVIQLIQETGNGG
ncbi:isochorismatase (plasmid) [Arthrobacter sp. ERGS1:01]|uniref:cysteine hydrolase family protein n=1 Tax=Arthrobacter sp. ERGS1:01 TaxID=1704044 RepID=UPI0006B4F9D9|nr:isochorismatase family cysteine hydrolase [Arthrobacter sp. ERGS1:01]ALE04359.1 isochorismatase [Arthrobacter sp. ERGS1:01]